MGLTLAAMLGQIGLPGGGFGHGYGSMNEPGLAPLRCRLPVLPQGPNPVRTFIPVAAVSDMLLHPGEPFDYNGLRLTYPDIRCVYWAGGNPFHHHQNIPRLRRALQRPDTIVVHDPYWTAMAKHADIVVPSTTAYERDDYSGGFQEFVRDRDYDADDQPMNGEVAVGDVRYDEESGDRAYLVEVEFTSFGASHIEELHVVPEDGTFRVCE